MPCLLIIGLAVHVPNNNIYNNKYDNVLSFLIVSMTLQTFWSTEKTTEYNNYNTIPLYLANNNHEVTEISSAYQGSEP